jgi:hypothetical protein
MTAASGPFIEFSLVGNKFISKQASVKTFFRRNPTPARAVFLDEEDNNPTAEIPIHTTRVHIVHVMTGAMLYHLSCFLQKNALARSRLALVQMVVCTTQTCG